MPTEYLSRVCRWPVKHAARAGAQAPEGNVTPWGSSTSIVTATAAFSTIDLMAVQSACISPSTASLPSFPCAAGKKNSANLPDGNEEYDDDASGLPALMQPGCIILPLAPFGLTKPTGGSSQRAC